MPFPCLWHECGDGFAPQERTFEAYRRAPKSCCSLMAHRAAAGTADFGVFPVGQLRLSASYRGRPAWGSVAAENRAKDALNTFKAKQPSALIPSLRSAGSSAGLHRAAHSSASPVMSPTAITQATSSKATVLAGGAYIVLRVVHGSALELGLLRKWTRQKGAGGPIG